MATMPAIITRVRRWSTHTNETKLPDSEIYDIANDLCSDLIERYEPWFCQRSTTLSVSAGFCAYALPEISDDTVDMLKKPLDICRIASGTRYDITFLYRHEFLDKYPYQSATSAPPDHYMMFGNKLYFGPTPDSAITIYIDGYFRPAELEDGVTHNNVVTRFASRWLTFSILEKLVKYGFEEDVRLGLFQSEIRDALHGILGYEKQRENIVRRTVMRRKG